MQAAPTLRESIPHQSRSSRNPGITIAAKNLGVTRTHLWAVLNGRRESKPLVKRWNAWLQANPKFLKANREKNPEDHPETAVPAH